MAAHTIDSPSMTSCTPARTDCKTSQKRQRQCQLRMLGWNSVEYYTIIPAPGQCSPARAFQNAVWYRGYVSHSSTKWSHYFLTSIYALDGALGKIGAGLAEFGVLMPQNGQN